MKSQSRQPVPFVHLIQCCLSETSRPVAVELLEPVEPALAEPPAVADEQRELPAVVELPVVSVAPEDVAALAVEPAAAALVWTAAVPVEQRAQPVPNGAARWAALALLGAVVVGSAAGTAASAIEVALVSPQAEAVSVAFAAVVATVAGTVSSAAEVASA
jgi:hypothetical protein